MAGDFRSPAGEVFAVEEGDPLGGVEREKEERKDTQDHEDTLRSRSRLGERLGRGFGIGKFGDFSKGEVGIKSGRGKGAEFCQIERAVGSEAGVGDVDELDTADDELGAVGGDVDDLFE